MRLPYKREEPGNEASCKEYFVIKKLTSSKSHMQVVPYISLIPRLNSSFHMLE